METDGRDAGTFHEELKRHYAAARFEQGFASACRMHLPEAATLRGRDVLDVGCRRGKGVYKLSAQVGGGGTAMGVDWNDASLAEARRGMDRAWRDSGLSHNNMDFRTAYPEDLAAADIASGVMDVVYVNSVMMLFYDPAVAVREFGRVLRPGGLLIMDTVLADRPRDDGVVTRARAVGNSIQAARTWEENLAWLVDAGFGEPSAEGEREVRADLGDREDHPAKVVVDVADVGYRAVTLFARKGGAPA